ncbi:MAG: hypothetical protein E6G56_09185 [Actinobacteria bacterium]|nr:MAG: hypothetical protein E6G56_09185 [Actinomycetota bacterium]
MPVSLRSVALAACAFVALIFPTTAGARPSHRPARKCTATHRHGHRACPKPRHASHAHVKAAKPDTTAPSDPPTTLPGPPTTLPGPPTTASDPPTGSTGNPAQQCRAEQADPSFADSHGGKSFAQFYGTNHNLANAFGKCVSSKAQAQGEGADDGGGGDGSGGGGG